MAETDFHKRDASTGELVQQLSREVSQLVRAEIALAKAEMTQKGRRAGVGAGLLSGGLVFALSAVGGSMAFFILLFGLVMPSWLAALIVTLVYAAVAAWLALQGKQRIAESAPPAPEMTIQSVKEDVEWAKTRATSKSG